MEQSHYWGFERNIELFVAGVQIELPRAGVRPELGHFVVNDDFDLSEVPHPFDFAFASLFLRRLSLNSIARCFASVSPQAFAWWTLLRNLDQRRRGRRLFRETLAGRQHHLAGSRAVSLHFRDAGGNRGAHRRPR